MHLYVYIYIYIYIYILFILLLYFCFYFPPHIIVPFSDSGYQINQTHNICILLIDGWQPKTMATFSETFDMRDLSVATDRGKGQSEGMKISVQCSLLCSVSLILFGFVQ